MNQDAMKLMESLGEILLDIRRELTKIANELEEMNSR